MKNITKFISIYLLIFVLCTASLAMAASFPADMVTKKNGETASSNTIFNGEVTVSPTLNGKPHGMPFKIYDPAGKQIYKNWAEGSQGQRLVRLSDGTYTIKVTTYVDGSIKSFENVIVETGQSQTVEAAFNFGKLTIAATLNEQPFSTPVKVYNSSGKQVLKSWTQNPRRTEMLAEGLYTVKVTNIKDTKQVVTFENVEVKNGETTERTGSFGE